MDSVFLYFADAPAQDITATLLAIRACEFLLPEYGAAIGKPQEPIVVQTDESRLNCWVSIEVEDYHGRDPQVRVQMREGEAVLCAHDAESMLGVNRHFSWRPATELELLAHHEYPEARLALELAILLLRRHTGVFEGIYGNLLTVRDIETVARDARATVYYLR